MGTLFETTVKVFDADNAGATDSAPALREALAALDTAGGGDLMILPGTYLLNSFGYRFGSAPYDMDFVAELPSNVRIVGQPGATFKVADGLIDSSTATWKGNVFIALNRENVAIENVAIDFNGANNLATQAQWLSYGLYTVDCSNIAVRRCYWRDTPGTNYIIAYGAAASNTPSGKGFIVDECVFRNGGTSLVGNTTQVDFSAVYSTNFGTRVTRCHIYHDVRPTTWCGGIELHASDSCAVDNIVEDSYPAIYLGQTPSSIERINISDNLFKNCHSGIVFPQGLSDSGDYKNVTISSNRCTLSRLSALGSGYLSDFIVEANPSYGGAADWTQYPFTIHGLNITGNVIESLNGTEADEFTNGVTLSSVNGANITGNTFRGLSGPPLRIFGSPFGSKHVRFTDNLCVDFGNHSHVSNPRFGVGMLLLGSSTNPTASAYTADDVVVMNNTFALSSAATHSSVVYSDFDAGTSLTNWVCHNNIAINLSDDARGTNTADTPVTTSF